MMQNFNPTDQEHNNYTDPFNFYRHRLLKLAYYIYALFLSSRVFEQISKFVY